MLIDSNLAVGTWHRNFAVLRGLRTIFQVTDSNCAQSNQRYSFSAIDLNSLGGYDFW